MAYKKKDFIAQSSRDSIRLWNTVDGKYYISTAKVEGATFWLFEEITENGMRIGYQGIYEGNTFEDCLNYLNQEK